MRHYSDQASGLGIDSDDPGLGPEETLEEAIAQAFLDERWGVDAA